ncbi:MAG: hypothetical protein HQK65_18290 [Desulfamplus sp.]|nr:hypothetical protein [Desulfamplus sp.]
MIKKNPGLFDFQAAQETVPCEKPPPATEVEEEKTAIPEPVVEAEAKIPDYPASIYQAVLPVILNKLDNPTTVEELAGTLDVNKTQLNAWLKKAVDENKIIKLSKPVRYVGR